jgi:hypothetical protein
MVRVWRRLERVAQRFLGKHSLAISIAGRLYLSFLLQKASLNIAAEGLAEDEQALEEADDRVELLLAVAGGLASDVARSSPLMLAGLPAGSAQGQITFGDLREALRQLGPVWPFVRRGRR